jgi:hypothetical protein
VDRIVIKITSKTQNFLPQQNKVSSSHTLKNPKKPNLHQKNEAKIRLFVKHWLKKKKHFTKKKPETVTTYMHINTLRRISVQSEK